MTRPVPLFAVVLGVAIVAGCGEKSTDKPVFQVHGKLTFENKPMGKAVISFDSVDETDRYVPSHGTADADGTYRLQTDRKNDGAPAGEYVVTIVWPGAKGKVKKPVDPGEDPDEDSPSDQLRGKYFPVNVTKLRATVKAAPDNEIHFNLP